MVDQEMSLFADKAPLLSTENLQAPIPDSDSLWHATSSTDWLTRFDSIHGQAYHGLPSVRNMFYRFVNGELMGPATVLSPMQLRLLLHPLQTQVYQLRQFLTCLPDGVGHGAALRQTTRAGLQQISMLLQKWNALSKQSILPNQDPAACANMILYHLISLNVITSFKSIEEFARRDVALSGFGHPAYLQARCIDQAEETFFHCGQVLRLITSMPVQVRPPWWSGAIYRVALTGWANSMANAGTLLPSHGHNIEVRIDALEPEDPLIMQYVMHRQGMPVLMTAGGQSTPMNVPSNIVIRCIDLLEQDSSMRLTDGIKKKLRQLLSDWEHL